MAVIPGMPSGNVAEQRAMAYGWSRIPGGWVSPAGYTRWMYDDPPSVSMMETVAQQLGGEHALRAHRAAVAAGVPGPGYMGPVSAMVETVAGMVLPTAAPPQSQGVSAVPGITAEIAPLVPGVALRVETQADTQSKIPGMPQEVEMPFFLAPLAAGLAYKVGKPVAVAAGKAAIARIKTLASRGATRAVDKTVGLASTMSIPGVRQGSSTSDIPGVGPNTRMPRPSRDSLWTDEELDAYKRTHDGREPPSGTPRPRRKASAKAKRRSARTQARVQSRRAPPRRSRRQAPGRARRTRRSGDN